MNCQNFVNLIEYSIFRAPISVIIEPVILICDDNSPYYAPGYDKNVFTIGAAITIDGIKDTSNNPVEKQTWQFNGLEWMKE